jgi:predicted nuclease of predicted toxin-antitoxin system
VRAVAEDGPGAADAEVLALAREDRRVLLTQDRDFAELVFKRGSRSFGAAWLVVRPRSVRRRALGGSS